MGTKYSHLSLEERCRLRGMIEMDLSVSEIARRMDRHRSTIQRELERNRCADGYRPDSAGRRAWARKLRGSRIARSTRLRAHVEDRLAMGWSPEQIAGRMDLDGSEHTLSAESIYRHAYSPAGRRAGLPRLLVQRKPKRGRRRRNGRRDPAIPNRTPIHQRPTKAHLRSQFGHWEGDLMHFRRQRDILLTLQAEEDQKSIRGIDFPTKALPADLGPTSSRQRRRHRRGSHRRRAARAAGQGAAHDNPRQRPMRGSSAGLRPRLSGASARSDAVLSVIQAASAVKAAVSAIANTGYA
jgi:IS30 family transposase